MTYICLVGGAAMLTDMTMRTMGMMTMRMTWRSLPGTGAGPQCPLWRMMTTEAAWRAHYKSLITKVINQQFMAHRQT